MKSLAGKEVEDTKRITVVDPKFKKPKKTKKLVTTYEFDPIDEVSNYQKFVDRYKHFEVQKSDRIPQHIKKIHSHRIEKKIVVQDSVTWTI